MMAGAPAVTVETAERREQFEREAVPHLDALFGYALRLTRGDEARADDFVQETMMSAFRAWHTFRPGSNCRAWLFRILHNHAVTWFRKGERHSKLDLHDVAERRVFEDLVESDPEGRFFADLIDDEVVRAIDALPDIYREAVVLSDLQGLTYGEVAEVTGVALGTVKSRLFRARQALQRELYAYAHEAGYLGPDTERPGAGEP